MRLILSLTIPPESPSASPAPVFTVRLSGGGCWRITRASGSLLKTAPADPLVAAVRIAAAGDALLSPPITRRLIEHYARQTRPPAPDQAHRLAQLTVLCGRAP
jgi:hypothetical protein